MVWRLMYVLLYVLFVQAVTPAAMKSLSQLKLNSDDIILLGYPKSGRAYSVFTHSIIKSLASWKT